MQTTESSPPRSGLQVLSLLHPSGEVEVSLAETPVPAPQGDEVLVRVEAAPVNPSDLGLLFAGADLTLAVAAGTPGRPVIKAMLPPAALQELSGRIGQPLPVGNEGAGVVIEAGSAPEARALLGRTVALRGGGMYAQYRCVPVGQCVPLDAGTTAAEGAAWFVNPMTALGMVDTMRREGHRALVHTAAGSSLGRMLQRLCAQDGVALVNVVRRPQQVELLRAQGAAFVCDSSSPQFAAELTDALAATGATIAFDATGGGTLAGRILVCMEAALTRGAQSYSRYGSTTHKQVYLYGRLDPAPIEFRRTGFGSAWGMGGWLLSNWLGKLDAASVRGFQQRVVTELKSTFASQYMREVSLSALLSLEHLAVYGRRATGGKYLVNPAKADC